MVKALFFLFLLALILNPYTVIGPLGYFLVLPFVSYSVFRYGRYFDKETVFLAFIMIFISFVGVLSSFAHGIGQLEHLKVSISILIYLIAGFGLYFVFRERGMGFDDVVYIALLVICFNSFFILLEVVFPIVRDTIEPFLAPSGNIDWRQGYRYRGIASGGAASLSTLIPVAVALALYLYERGYVGFLKTVFLISLLVLSLFFIGRTGLILLPFVFLSFFLFNFKKYYAKVFVLFVFSSFLLIFSFDYIRSFLITQYGVGFYNYSLGFLLEGRSGLEEEGTVGIIRGFLTVMPFSFPEVLFGYGFYGGSEFEPWTDSGYSRMFLSVGYFFGVSFYLCFFILAYKSVRFKQFLFATIILILLIAEAKEPLLFSKYSSRLLFVLLGFAILDRKFRFSVPALRVGG